jgi:hypothetical protein
MAGQLHGIGIAVFNEAVDGRAEKIGQGVAQSDGGYFLEEGGQMHVVS